MKPIGDKIIIRPDKAETQTASGLYIPEAHVDKAQVGTVYAVPSESTLGKNPVTVKEGDRVMFPKFGGIEIEKDGGSYLLIRNMDIYAVL